MQAYKEQKKKSLIFSIIVVYVCVYVGTVGYLLYDLGLQVPMHDLNICD